MWANKLAALSVAAFLLVPMTSASAQEPEDASPWAEFARMDIEAVRVMLANNHSDPVEPAKDESWTSTPCVRATRLMGVQDCVRRIAGIALAV